MQVTKLTFQQGDILRFLFEQIITHSHGLCVEDGGAFMNHKHGVVVGSNSNLLMSKFGNEPASSLSEAYDCMTGHNGYIWMLSVYLLYISIVLAVWLVAINM